MEGRYQLVFISPELLLEHRRWRSIICSEIYLQCLKGFVVDEAHTVITWLVRNADDEKIAFNSYTCISFLLLCLINTTLKETGTSN